MTEVEEEVSLRRWIEEEVAEVQQKVNEECERVGIPEPGSALDQEGLRDGSTTVLDYLEHGKGALAFEHFLYMITELDVQVSKSTLRLIERAGTKMNLDPAMWQTVRYVPDA